jgi:acylphosphatase
MVQGVGFRWFTLRAARALALAGWVRNEPDGSVEVLVDGDAGELERFAGELRRGPEGAAVADVHVSVDASVERLPRPFEIAGHG